VVVVVVVVVVWNVETLNLISAVFSMSYISSYLLNFSLHYVFHGSSLPTSSILDFNFSLHHAF
jgi:hypothetical protein